MSRKTRARYRKSSKEKWVDPCPGHRKLLLIIEYAKELERLADEICEELGENVSSRNGENRFSILAEKLQGMNGNMPEKGRYFLKVYTRFFTLGLELQEHFQGWIQNYARRVAAVIGGIPEDYTSQLASAFMQGLARMREPNYKYLRQWLAQKASRLIKAQRTRSRYRVWVCPVLYEEFQGTKDDAKNHCRDCEYKTKDCKLQDLGPATTQPRMVALDELLFEEESPEDFLLKSTGTYADEEGEVHLYSQVLSSHTIHPQDFWDKADYYDLLERLKNLPLPDHLEVALSCLSCMIKGRPCAKGVSFIREHRDELQLLVSFSRQTTNTSFFVCMEPRRLCLLEDKETKGEKGATACQKP